MANRFCNLDGNKKIKDDFQNITKGFDKVETEIDTLNSNINTVDNRVDEIITTPIEGVSAAEIIDARKGEVSLGAKITKMDNALASHEADYENLKEKIRFTQSKRYIIPAGMVGWVRIASQQNIGQRFAGTLRIDAISGSGSNIGNCVVEIASNQKHKKLNLINSIVGNYGIKKIRLVDPNAEWTSGNYIDVYVNVYTASDLTLYAMYEHGASEVAHLNTPISILNLLDEFTANPEIPVGYRTTEIELV